MERFLKFPATRHGLEDAVEDAKPAAMVDRATKAQEKINQRVEQIQASTPKALDPAELLERQVNDAAEAQRKIDNQAWGVDVYLAASKDLTNSTHEFTEFEQAFAAPRHVDPNPTHPLVLEELERMAKEKLMTPTGTIEMNNLYLNPAAMKEWQTGFLQKEIDARAIQAQEKLEPLMQAGTHIRRAEKIQQAADDLNLQAKKRYKSYWIKGRAQPQNGWRPGLSPEINIFGQWTPGMSCSAIHGGYWQICEHLLADQERDDLSRMGIEAIELAHKVEHLPVNAAQEKEGLRLLADATDIAKHNPDLDLNTSKIDEIRSEYDKIKGEYRNVYQLYKHDSNLIAPPWGEYPLAERIFGRLQVIDFPDGTRALAPHYRDFYGQEIILWREIITPPFPYWPLP